MSQKQKLELTWIGKDKQPSLEPRILIEDDGKSRGERNADRACANAKQAGNTAICGNSWDVFGNIAESSIFLRNILAVVRWISYLTDNTRAVPLARKGDAHQGRVFYFRLLRACEEYGL